jgi:DNA-binding NarL/FixJ family response regulator
LWVQAFDQLLNRMGVEVVGKTTEPEKLVDLLELHRPDILVMEFDLTNELAALSDLRSAFDVIPELRVIAVSDAVDVSTIEALILEGAAAFCTKAAAPDDFAAAIRQTFNRSFYMAPVRSDGGATPRTWFGGPGRNVDLTRRELEILALVAEGHSNSQLARMLWVTEQTVKFHLSNIYRKLDVANRTEASRWAQLHGLLSDRPRELASAS